jgi:2-polyprenyl-3-methyl-5-hydroxy-6-metoxy-1,4-benzoquinol methylase
MSKIASPQYRERVYAAYAASKGCEPAASAADPIQMRALLHRVREWLPADHAAPCIDVGCGSGLLLMALANAGFTSCEGIDCSAEQVATASKVAARVSLGDATAHLRSRVNAYDLITAMDIVEHFDKDELLDFMDAASAALRPGGRLIVQTPNAGSPWGMKVRYGDLTHELALDTESLGQAFRLAGFAAVEARECRPYVHGPLSAVRWILWQLLHGLLWAWNVVETGSACGSVYTRVFVAKADKPHRGQ